VLQLEDGIAALRLVISGSLSPSSSTGITSTPPQSASAISAAANTQVTRVLASLLELLSHPQAQEPQRVCVAVVPARRPPA
jgi:hypothetical protein